MRPSPSGTVPFIGARAVAGAVLLTPRPPVRAPAGRGHRLPHPRQRLERRAQELLLPGARAHFPLARALKMRILKGALLRKMRILKDALFRKTHFESAPLPSL
jgi:hypothetical protein